MSAYYQYKLWTYSTVVNYIGSKAEVAQWKLMPGLLIQLQRTVTEYKTSLFQFVAGHYLSVFILAKNGLICTASIYYDNIWAEYVADPIRFQWSLGWSKSQRYFGYNKYLKKSNEEYKIDKLLT